MFENYFVGVRPSNTIDTVRKLPTMFREIDEFLYVRKPNGSVALVTEYPEGVRPDRLWDTAEKNTFKDITAERMSAKLGLPPMPNDPIVLTTKDGLLGASAVLDRKTMNRIADELGVDKLVVLPSSVHEVLLMPYDEETTDLDELTEMVMVINREQVAPRDRLADKALLYERNL